MYEKPNIYYQMRRDLLTLARKLEFLILEKTVREILTQYVEMSWFIYYPIMLKVKLSLSLNKHHAMKEYWRSGGITPLILWPRHYMEMSGQLHAPAALPQERTPGTNWIGGWVGPRAALDAVVKRKIPSPGRESNPRTPIVQPIAQDS
jgi:hypothetical protein